MKVEQKKQLKKIIDGQIEELQEEIEAMKIALYPKKGNAPSDKVAHLYFKQEQSINIQRLEEATKRLNRLKNAYLKIDTKDYGICKECEEPIPLPRLELMPESLYCVACIQELGI